VPQVWIFRPGFNWKQNERREPTHSTPLSNGWQGNNLRLKASALKRRPMKLQKLLFTVSLTIASRFVQIRDRILGRVPRSRPECPGISATQHTISSGKNLIDAVYVAPSAGSTHTAVLICHGIGEIVAQWFPIQRLLAENGIASLVFDYSGYGRSTGFIDFTQCEHDAIASFQLLRRLAPAAPIAILGMSLGTGIASAILTRVRADRLVLCAGFSSFREAARAVLIPPLLSPLVPPIWSAEEALRDCCLPVLIVQGDRDRLFPMQMAHDLVSCCGSRAELLVLPARSHNYPFYHPQMDYWGPIISWLLPQDHPPTEANLLTR
jgi:alpha-beta hydrolase superfamily lysophospholipase